MEEGHTNKTIPKNPTAMPKLRFADVSELHPRLDRNPVNPQTR